MKAKTTMMSVMLLSAVIIGGKVNAQGAYWRVAGNTGITGTQFLGTIDGSNLVFKTLNVERMRINGNVANAKGFVGIGTSSPVSMLHVDSINGTPGNVTVTDTITTNHFKMKAGAINGRYLKSDANGNATWATLAETDPQVGANTKNKVPLWNGSALVTGTIFDSASFVGVGTNTPACKLAVANNSMGGIATHGSFQIGENNTQNLVLDNNEVQSRSNGGASTLFLQYWAGDMDVCHSGGTTTFNGPVIGQGATFGLTHLLANAGLIATSSILNVEAPVSSAHYPNIGFTYNGDGVQLFGTPNATGLLVYNWAGSSYAPISASAFQVNSDRTLKKDIVEIGANDYTDYMNQIRNIESITYRYNNELPAANNADPSAVVRETPHVGFTAQSLPAAVQCKMLASPKIGADTKLGYNLSDMAGLTLIGVKAVDAKTQLLEKQVNDLTTQVKELQTALSRCCSSYSPAKNGTDNSTINADKASLEQNAPNPFSEETTIHYYLPSNSTAVLKVMSLDGKEILANAISKTGYGEVRISGSTMAAGTYTYTLIVNGKAVESKIMVLTR